MDVNWLSDLGSVSVGAAVGMSLFVASTRSKLGAIHETLKAVLIRLEKDSDRLAAIESRVAAVEAVCANRRCPPVSDRGSPAHDPT